MKKYKKPLIEKMIRKILYDIPVDFSDYVVQNIEPEQIIDYIQANKIYDNLKEMN